MPRAPSAPKPTKVRKKLLEQLRNSIIDGTFKPGDRLVERELGETFKVSRPSVREAVRQLEAEFLIEIIPHRGPVVRTLDLDEVVSLMDLRLVIGGLAARRFAEKGTVADIAAFEASIMVHARALEAQDHTAVKSTKSALFEAFAAGAHNPPLSRALRQINAQMSFSWSSSLQVPGRPQESVAELLTLLSAIRQRNADAANAAFLLYSEHVKSLGIQRFKALHRDSDMSPPANNNIMEMTA